MAEDLSEIKEMSKDIGPKKVETPHVKVESHDPVQVIRAANLLASRKIRPMLSNCDVTIATPKTRRNQCSGQCTEDS